MRSRVGIVYATFTLEIQQTYAFFSCFLPWIMEENSENPNQVVQHANIILRLAPLKKVKYFFSDRAKAVLLLWFIFVIYVSRLS